MNTVKNLVGSLVLLSISVVLCLAVAEFGLRLIDGYQITSASLVFSRKPDLSHGRQEFLQSLAARARRYAADIKIDPSFQLEWYDAVPPEQIAHKPIFPVPADWAKAVAQATGRDRRELSYWYNYNFVKELCDQHIHYDELSKFKATPGFVYTFAGPDKTDSPQFRYVPGWDFDPEGNYEGHNNFGFDGADIPYPKPPNTIRIAFFGYSTTEGGDPWTYPDLVGQMLREWAHSQRLDVDFDVINAGRIGVGSGGMARIMRYEVAPLQPDIVVIYTGGANLTPQAFGVVNEPSRFFRMPRLTQLMQLTHYSALAVRINELTGRMQVAGSEPVKPPHKLRFDLSQDVDIERKDLPFDLHQEISDFRDIAQSAQTHGAEVFLTSTVLLSHAGLQLDRRLNWILYDELNIDCDPLTYAEIRQGVEFQNRAYRALSEKDHLGFIEFDKYFPQDPDLFDDTVHFSSEAGYRLHAWIVAQQLAPVILDKLRKHELPRQSVGEQADISWVRQTPRRFDLNCLP